MPWFKKGRGEDPLRSKWLEIFLIGSDIEAQQMLVEHQAVLLRDETVRRIQVAISRLKRQGMEARIIQKVEDHLALLEDARRSTVQEAIRRNEQKNDEKEWTCRQFLATEIDNLPTFTQQHRDILLRTRTVDYIEWFISNNREMVGEELFKLAQGRLQFLKDACDHDIDYAWDHYIQFRVNHFKEDFPRLRGSSLGED